MELFVVGLCPSSGATRAVSRSAGEFWFLFLSRAGLSGRARGRVRSGNGAHLGVGLARVSSALGRRVVHRPTSCCRQPRASGRIWELGKIPVSVGLAETACRPVRRQRNANECEGRCVGSRRVGVDRGVGVRAERSDGEPPRALVCGPARGHWAVKNLKKRGK